MNTFPITSHLRSSFRKIGADVRVIAPQVPRRTWRAAAVSRERIRVHHRLFELILPPQASAVVLDCRKDERHLVLTIQEPGGAPEKFLCGFDERHWFAASVAASTVPAAKESLMPPGVREAVGRAGLRHADRYRRHTKAFLRQGEWFFVPTTIKVNPLVILHHEPLIRPGGGKPHIVDEIMRGGGEMVWHHAQHAPNGVTEKTFRLQTEAIRRSPGWSRRMRFQEAGSILARGAVRHPDHATIHLSSWHRVYINSEQRPASLGFLD